MLRGPFLLIGIFVSICLIELNQAQQNVCSSLESNVDYKGNDLSFTYDTKTPQGIYYLIRFLSFLSIIILLCLISLCHHMRYFV